jgi:hypothetical protein
MPTNKENEIKPCTIQNVVCSSGLNNEKMEQTKEVAIRDINDILEAVSRIERQVELIKQGKTEVGETGIDRLDVIKEKAMLIRIIGKRM